MEQKLEYKWNIMDPNSVNLIVLSLYRQLYRCKIQRETRLHALFFQFFQPSPEFSCTILTIRWDFFRFLSEYTTLLSLPPSTLTLGLSLNPWLTTSSYVDIISPPSTLPLPGYDVCTIYICSSPLLRYPSPVFLTFCPFNAPFSVHLDGSSRPFNLAYLQPTPSFKQSIVGSVVHSFFSSPTSQKIGVIFQQDSVSCHTVKNKRQWFQTQYIVPID